MVTDELERYISARSVIIIIIISVIIVIIIIVIVIIVVVIVIIQDTSETNDNEVGKSQTFSYASYKFEGSFALMNVMISQELDSDQLLNIHAGGARGSLKITQSGRSLTRPLAPKGKVNEPPLSAACRGPGCIAASNSSDGDAQPEHPFLTPSLPYHVSISSQGLAPYVSKEILYRN